MIYPLKSGWQVLDIGANQGLWTREAVRLGCTVVACEPIAKYRQSILDAGAAIVLPVAVSDIADKITLNVGADDRFSSVHAEWVKEADSVFGWNQDVRQYTVDTMRLDRIISVYGEFDFIKIDTEGHEPSVIRSLGEHRPKRMSLEYHGGKYLLQSMHNSTYEALELLGSNYVYRYVAESQYYVSHWLTYREAAAMLPELDWGDLLAFRTDAWER
ncbi:MAG: FkbM family methyltransferase [Pseudomonadota bacterium]